MANTHVYMHYAHTHWKLVLKKGLKLGGRKHNLEVHSYEQMPTLMEAATPNTKPTRTDDTQGNHPQLTGPSIGKHWS